MSRITYFPRYASHENAVTNTTLHLFAQINHHSADRFQTVLSALLGDVDMPLGISFEQQTRLGPSVPDAIIRQEPIHIVIETKVGAPVDVGQLLRHCGAFERASRGNYLILLTKDKPDEQSLQPVRARAGEVGGTFTFCPVTFEELCDCLKDAAHLHETHLRHVMEDYVNYCSEMGLLPDRRKWLRVVPCGKTYELNAKWNMYYQPTDRGYSPFHYLGIYTGKAVRLAGTVAAVYDSEEDVDGAMALKFVEGADRPEYRERIRGMVLDTKASVGWDLTSGMRFFCADPFALTEYQKKSPGGIQGARYLDVSEPAQLSATDGELAERLRMLSWE